MKYFIIFFGFLCYGCGCWDTKMLEAPKYTGYQNKKFTVVNHTDKTYTNNALYSLVPKKSDTWKLFYYTTLRDGVFTFQKINTINPEAKKNDKNKVLELYSALGCIGYSGTYGKENLFLFSLDGGKKKIFFGAYDYKFKEIWGEADSDCNQHFIRWDVHPVWQEKELTIHIYEDKIKFSDSKIKEVKKIKAFKSKEEIELKNLEIVPCDEE